MNWPRMTNWSDSRIALSRSCSIWWGRVSCRKLPNNKIEQTRPSNQCITQHKTYNIAGIIFPKEVLGDLAGALGVLGVQGCWEGLFDASPWFSTFFNQWLAQEVLLQVAFSPGYRLSGKVGQNLTRGDIWYLSGNSRHKQWYECTRRRTFGVWKSSQLGDGLILVLLWRYFPNYVLGSPDMPKLPGIGSTMFVDSEKYFDIPEAHWNRIHIGIWYWDLEYW